MLVTYATYTLLMKQGLTGASLIEFLVEILSSSSFNELIFSFQDLFQYSGVYSVEGAARLFVI